MDSFTKREQVILIVVVFAIILSLGYKLLIKDNYISQGQVQSTNASHIDPVIEGNESYVKQDILEDTLIMVHISGQVYSPGIIELVHGDRVIDAVNFAGGLTKDADLDRINLAKKLIDEEKIYIPKIGEELNYDKTSDANNIDVKSVSSSNNDGKLNINLSTQEELETLPGIGIVTASRIIEYRSSNPFKNIEELKNVSGIGDKKYEAIKDLIKVK